MGIKDITKLLNQLKDVAIIRNHRDILSIQLKPCLSYFIDKTSISFPDEDDIAFFNTVIDAVWKSDQDIYYTVAQKVLIEKIIGLIQESSKNKSQIMMQHTEQLYQKLRAEPVIEFAILRPIYGLEFSSDSPFELGPFIIYDLSRHRQLIEHSYPNARLVLNETEPKDSQRYIIGTKCNARHAERAKEFADKKFKQFENTIQYMMADRSGFYHVGVFDYRQWSPLESAILSKSKLSKSFDPRGARMPVDIADPYFTKIELGHDRIWMMLAKSTSNNIERRILSSIEWIGKGIADLDNSRAFIQIIFALESLLSHQEKDIITPSIMHCLSECAAFIVGESYEERDSIERQVKHFFKCRNDIVHGRDRAIKAIEMRKAINILRKTIVKLLTHDDLKKFTSIDQVMSWIRNKKYSCGSDETT